jgi:hypothetical protein
LNRAWRLGDNSPPSASHPPLPGARA